MLYGPQDDQEDEIDKLLSLDWLHEAWDKATLALRIVEKYVTFKCSWTLVWQVQLELFVFL